MMLVLNIDIFQKILIITINCKFDENDIKMEIMYMVEVEKKEPKSLKTELGQLAFFS